MQAPLRMQNATRRWLDSRPRRAAPFKVTKTVPEQCRGGSSASGSKAEVKDGVSGIGGKTGHSSSGNPSSDKWDIWLPDDEEVSDSAMDAAVGLNDDRGYDEERRGGGGRRARVV